jgi:hypothetical protein
MPIITRLPDEEAAFMEHLRREFPVGRPGLHQSDAIRCNIYATVLPALVAVGVDVRYSDATLLRFKTGKLWESALLRGTWRQQYEIGSPHDDSVGTVDGMLPHTWYPIEAKTTQGSCLADLSDATRMQIGGYAARLMLAHGPHAEVWHGELRTIHLNGDCGKNKCPAHGYPEEEKRRLNPETNRQRLCCPVCQGWMSGDQAPEKRRLKLSWPRDELLSLHKLLTWRLGELKEDRETYVRQHRAYFMPDNTWQLHASLPEWKWGYPQTECAGCEVRELVGCPGQEGVDEVEAEMTGSIFEPERETV